MSPTHQELTTVVISAGYGLLNGAVTYIILQHLRIRRLLAQLESEQHNARHDPLTGLANRRALWPLLEASLADTSQPTTVAVIDLDKFKDVNDAADHTFGDHVLTEVAASLAALPIDLAARLGGDEFAVVIRGDAQHAAEVIREALQAIRRTVEPPGGGPPIILTASFGWATAYAGESARLVLRRADLANRHAKRHHLGIHP